MAEARTLPKECYICGHTSTWMLTEFTSRTIEITGLCETHKDARD